MKRKLRLPREVIAQLSASTLPAVRGGFCTGSCDTCPSLAFTCFNTCTA